MTLQEKGAMKVKPKTSKLLLDNYFLAELFVRANENFDSKEPMNLSAKDLTVESIAVKIAEDVRHWQVTLKVFHQLKNKVNAPYSFRVEAVGFFSVVDTYPEDRAEWLVKTNASSVLYSVAREALRSAMATGPWKPVLLPTVSFYTEEAREFIKGKIENKPTDIAK